MSTHCNVIQFLEPDPASVIYTSSEDHSLPIEEGGALHLQTGVQSYDIHFAMDKVSDDYDLIEDDVTNTVDGDPLALTATITARDKSGFTVQFNAAPDTNNYTWNWKVRVGVVTT